MSHYEDTIPQKEKGLRLVKPEVSETQEQPEMSTPEKVGDYSHTVRRKVEKVVQQTDTELAQGEATFVLDSEDVEEVQNETGVKGKLDSNWDALMNLQRLTQERLKAATDTGESSGEESERSGDADVEQSLLNKGKEYFRNVHNEKIDFIAEQCPDIAPEDIRFYLQDFSPEVETYIKNFGESGLLIQLAEYLPSSNNEGDGQPALDYRLIGLDENIELIKELDEQYGMSHGPLTEDFLREHVFDMRANYLLAQAKNGEKITRVDYGKRFLSFLYDRYLTNGMPVPPQLKLLLSSGERSDLTAARTKQMEYIEDEDRTEKTLSVLKERLKIDNEKKKSQLADQGIHSAMANRMIAVEEEKREENTPDILAASRDEENREMEQIEDIIKRNPDPRAVMEKILGLQNGEIPLRKNKKAV